MPDALASMSIVISPMPTTHFGAGAISALPGIVQRAGADAAVLVTDNALAATQVVSRVGDTLESGGITTVVFSGVHPNPSITDLAAGADTVAALAAQAGRIMLVAVGGGSAIDAAKGIALAAVNPERGRDLDYRREFSRPALPIVAVPTTAGTGAETNAFAVVTDPQAGRKFYVGHASSLPAAAILDPELTYGLPPAATAATGMDALTHALESSMSRRANPWSDGIARQVIRMIGAHLPRAVANGADCEARAQMLLAAHLAGVAMATTGLGVCHAIGHSLGGRFGIPHGVALTMVLPAVLRFNRPSCESRLADVAFALGAGDTARSTAWNATAAIEAITALAAAAGMAHRLSDFGITPADFGQIAADALNDEVLASTPRMPTGGDICELLVAAEIA
jgi:alcohol dehydrogenase